MAESDQRAVGYVGLGVMGSSIVRRLLAAGHEVTVWNRTREKADALLAAGARWADSPREVAERSEIVFTMVTNTAAVRAVTEGEDGILAGLAPGKVYVDMSTASPANTRALAERVAEGGAQMLDSPVSGTSITVDQGKATLMVGGDEDAFERCRPVLDAIGPCGWLVNIGRGSVVDTQALAAALREGRIAGAGLDVYESEPKPPQELIGLDNLLITPHVAGWSPEATQASVDRFMANAEGHFAGRGVVSPI